MNTKTPSQGLKILEQLHNKLPYHQGIKNRLINAYIKYNYVKKAVELIEKKSNNKTDVQSLKLKSWLAYQHNDLDTQKYLWNEILDKSYLASVHAQTDTLIKISKKNINIQSHDIVLFTHVYNEMLRLPNLISYYRELGVTQFFVIDNNSTDNCQQFLLSQPDVHLFWTNEDHTRSGEGMVWYQKLINQYLKDNWLIVVDADEFLVYPNCEKYKLSTLTTYLDTYGYNAMTSFMLDMFPRNLSEQLAISPNESFIKQSPYFYNHYHFIGHIDPPYWDVDGGIFYHFNNFLPPLIKTPLIKASAGIQYIQTHHRITPTNIAPMNSAFLHFKFMGDFTKKAKVVMKEKRYWGGGSAYRKYAKIYENNTCQDVDFSNLDKTVKYQNSLQLVDLELIRCPDEWLEFIKEEK